MRQQQRSQELAISQLENHPGGFQHLRRMYEEIQAPMEEAASEARALSSGAASPSAQPSGPLPNPWGSPQATSPASSPASSLAGGFPPNGDPPAAMAALAANPGMLPQVGNSPVLAQMAAGNPQMAAQLQLMAQHPHLVQQARSNPAVQQMMRDPRARMPGPSGDLASVLGQLGVATVTPPLPAAAPPAFAPSPPDAALEEQLRAMGFGDRAANHAALAASGGNLNAAVEWLLSRQPH